MADVIRISGATRVNTAVEVSKRDYPDGSERIVIMRADSAADVGAATTHAAKLGVPLLLTPGDSLHPATRAEIVRLEACHAEIVGGPDVISGGVKDAIQAALEEGCTQ